MKSTSPPSEPSAVALVAPELRARLRGLLLSGFVVLLVATPLIPSEGAIDDGSNAIFSMAWLLLVLAWLIVGLLQPRFSLRWCVVDWALLGFIVWHSLSAVVMIDEGQARPVLNATWLWIGLTCSYFLGRQLLARESTCRAVTMVMICLAVGTSMLAFRQYAVDMPRMRAEFERDPQAMLAKAGVYAPEGSPEFELFKNRLESTEPMGTFALTNSLAGFLTPWLIVVLAIALNGWQPKALRWRIWCVAAVCIVLLGYCLVLTKSRTALLAWVFGVLLLGWVHLIRNRRIDWRIPVGICGVLVCVGLLVGVAASVGAFDVEVISETPKSLLYRWEYWKATAAMIGDHLWFGCGPGNFRDFYPAYKLPQASETIADPHNFLLEIWATAGTPAAVAFLAVLIVGAWRVVRLRNRDVEPSLSPEPSLATSEVAADSEPWWIVGGAVAGVVFAFIVGPLVGFAMDVVLLWVGVPAAVICGYGFLPWVVTGRFPAWIAAIAATVLLVNLLAAGGISFAGVSQSLWLLAAITLNLAEEGADEVQVTRRVGIGMAAWVLVLIVACQQLLYGPVLQARSFLSEGDFLARQADVVGAEIAYRRAADADPFAVQPWISISSLDHRRAMQRCSPEAIASFGKSIERGLSLARRSQAHWRRAGDSYYLLYQSCERPELLESAIGAYQKAITLYPNYNMGHAKLAWCYHMAGRDQDAALEAGEALRLDGLHSHQERKLRSQALFQPAVGLIRERDAEQWMKHLAGVESQ